MVKEAKQEQLPPHGVVETMPRLCLANVASDMQQAVLDYRRREVAAATRQAHVAALLRRVCEPGVIRVEEEPPQNQR